MTDITWKDIHEIARPRYRNGKRYGFDFKFYPINTKWLKELYKK